MRPLSIRLRLALVNALLLMAASAVAGAAAWFAVQDSVFDTVDGQLVQWARAHRAAQDDHATAARAAALEADLGPQMALRLSAQGRTVYASTGARAWPGPPLTATEPRDDTAGVTGSVNGRRVRIVAVPFADASILEVGMPVDEFVEVIEQFETSALIAVPLLVLFAMAGGYWMSARVLAPVERVTLAARAISARHLDERLPLRGVDDEIDRLSQTLNDMFLRLHQGFQRITRFTADASHELRTPVAIIRTTAEVCRQQRRAPDDYEEALDRIIAESGRASRLIDDLLTLARADGGAELERASVDLVDVVRDAVDEGAILCAAAGVQLEAPLTGRLPISGDADALRRLFVALLENAAKYTRPGGRVRVTTRYEGKAAVVEVADSGVGIPPADLPHVFDRFYRTSPDRSRATGGTGLGLSIAQWIATAHDGTIVVDSTLGKGTRITVSLPSLGSPS